MITTEQVKEIRERTGVGLAKCKSALEECGGDIEKAIEHLRKQGIASAVKKEARVAKEGRVAYVATSDTIAVVEMNAETDFVVNNERFRQLQTDIVNLLAHTKVGNVQALLDTKMPQWGNTVDEMRKELMAVLGENIVLPRAMAIHKNPHHSYGLYSHMGGKIFVLVELSGSADLDDFAREIAMHIAAEAPEYLKADDVPAHVKAKEEEIAKEQAPKDKPAQVVEKIVQGKVKAFYDQVCLLNQKYIKDNAISVGDLVAKRGASVVRFIRWQVGATV